MHGGSIEAQLPANVFITMPAFGRMNCSETTASLIYTVAELMNKQIGFLFGVMSFPDIAELRNVMATIFYDAMPQCTHWLQIDADMRFDGRMVTDFIAFDKGLVGGSYRTKDDPVSFVGNSLEGPPQIENGYIKRRDIGAGAMLIRRDCLATILENNPRLSDLRVNTHHMKEMLKEYGLTRVLRFFDPIEMEHGRLSEDLSFCKRARDSGIDVWGSLQHSITHIGLRGYEGNYGEWLKAEAAKGNG